MSGLRDWWRCFIGRHDEEVVDLGGWAFTVIRCRRCGDDCGLIERRTGLRYTNVEQYVDERSYVELVGRRP